jgi:hypothetical protein
MPVQGLSFSLSERDGDSNRLQPAGWKTKHTPIRTRPKARVGNLPPYLGYRGSDPNRKAQGTAGSQVAQAMPTHCQSLSRRTYLLLSNNANLSLDPSPTRVTWLHSRNELSSRYVNGTFNFNQGPDNEAVLKWHRRDQRTHAYPSPTTTMATPDLVRSPIIHYHMIPFHDSKYSQPW